MASSKNSSVSKHSLKLDARTAALQLLQQVLSPTQGISLREATKQLAQLPLSASEKGHAQDICYGVCRHYRLLNHWLDKQMKKPLKASAYTLRILFCCALYEIWFTERPHYAVVSQWPSLAQKHKFQWAKGLVNALLRQACDVDITHYRNTLPLIINYSLSDLLFNQWQRDWPNQLLTIAEASNLHPPMCLRNNQSRQNVNLLKSLFNNEGIACYQGEVSTHSLYLEQSLPVSQLPGFEHGLFSVQDEAAQLPAGLFSFDIKNNHPLRLLDACAAPGGKTSQLLELFPHAHVFALDVDQHRLKRVEQTLSRLQLNATLLQGDASHSDWWDQTLYDGILVDAPCSATGIVRRQPDIKWHRQQSDIKALVELQQRILLNLWPMLKPGGLLVYATCSINRQENDQQIQQFLSNHSDAADETPNHYPSMIDGPGCQLLPKVGQWDGFYFAKLRKAKRSE